MHCQHLPFFFLFPGQNLHVIQLNRMRGSPKKGAYTGTQTPDFYARKC